jgi:predicted nuclease of predicted toxin-antitoxin system
VSQIKLLLDENLSPSVAVALCQDGFDVVHVRDRGLNGATDAEVLDKAYEEDRVLVTANVADFQKLARARELHPGIVFLEEGDLLRDEQKSVVRRATEALSAEHAAGRDMVNRVLRISLTADPTFGDLP